ncbi:hypothetical protein GCM10020295_19020 [Streptomyces cinereospinus]
MDGGAAFTMLEGVQFFPVTPFTPTGSINLEVFSEHVRTGLDDGAGGVFVACGTGSSTHCRPMSTPDWWVSRSR